MIEKAGTLTQELYATSAEAVRLSFGSVDDARTTYVDYIDFVTRCVSADRDSIQMLDVGCGNGWSAYFFAQGGYDVTGVDLNEHAFQALPHQRLLLRPASALELPFGSEQFDVVASFQALEHMPAPEQALNEMTRVCRPGGTVCIVGPNLVSLGNNIKAMLLWSWRARPVRRIFIRDSGTPIHPAGNTIFETIAQFWVTIGRLVTKLSTPGYAFTMRVPDMQPPFYADNDACYLCNPVDLQRYFESRGFEVVKNGAWGRPRWTAWFAGGTWIAARKPGRPQ